MAVIAPSRSFEGSDLSTSVFGKLVKDGVRTVGFREERNKDGNFFFILPPYKADASGRGVSWKVVSVRDNFGIDVKELYAVPRNCPVAFFSSRAKQFYPEYTKVEQANVNGRTIKRYPPFGRLTSKVIFNVAYMNNMQLGAHVLTLPQFGGGEHIEAWGRRRMPDGSEAPLLNHPEAAIPVFIQLKKDAVGMPWVVTPEASKTYRLPAELADANYLYNLDDVIYYPEIDYLVDKLHSFIPTDIYNKCMTGYVLPNGITIGNEPTRVLNPGIPTASTAGNPQAFASTAVSGYPQASVPGPISIAPLGGMPRTTIPQAGIPTAQVAEVVPSIQAVNTSNPVAATPYTVEQARAYLERHKQ